MPKILIAALVLILGGIFAISAVKPSIFKDIALKISPTSTNPVAIVNQANKNITSTPTPTVTSSDQDIDNDMTALDKDLSEIDASEKTVNQDINNL